VSLNLNDTDPPFVEYDLADLNERLAERAYEWVPAYVRHGIISKNRRELRLANISGDGPRNEGSCVIGLRGEHAGDNWDFQTEKGGSPLDTLSHATGLFGRELFAKAAEIVGGQAKRATAGVQAERSRKVGRSRAHSSSDLHLGKHAGPAGNADRDLSRVSGSFLLPSTEDLRHCELCTDYANKIARAAP